MDTVKAGALGGGAAILAVVALAAVLLRPSDKKAGEQASGRAGDNAVSGSLSPASQNAQSPAPASQNSKSQPENSLNSLTLLGTLLPGGQAALSVRQPSRIVAVLVKDGQTVRKGQTVVQFDTADVVPQQQIAQAGVGAAQTLVNKAQAGRQAQVVKADSDITNARAGVRCRGRPCAEFCRRQPRR